MNRALILTLSLALAPAAPLMAAEATPPAAPAEAAAPAATIEKSPQQEVGVARAIITSAISNREPVDELSEVPANTQTVYLFTELRGMAGQHIKHRWMFNGQVVSEVDFDVKAPRWRVWSSKTMSPLYAGKWTVQVVDSNGELLVSREFNFAAR
ncbi:MAG TPA: DUF2914 domain-containing protein [Gammaproteobacteria bacterium]